jgi:hypothetical protein
MIGREPHGSRRRRWRQDLGGDYSLRAQVGQSALSVASPDEPGLISPAAGPRHPPAPPRDYVGQPAVREQMEIFIGAARGRGEALDHVLIFGPPGLGKTTLAHIVAHEMASTCARPPGRCWRSPAIWRRC